MITYCYRYIDPLTGEEEIHERDFPAGEAPRILRYEDGSHATRDYRAEGVSGRVVGTKNPIKGKTKRPWPMSPCFASGVHASQASELRKHLKDRGCPTEVTKDGDPVYTSAAHRKKALRIRGMHDRNSFI